MTPQSRRALWAIYIVLMLIFLMAPLLLIFVYSFAPGRYLQLPPTSFSVRWYAAFFENEAFMLGLKNTAILCLVTPPLCLAIALPAAHAIARRMMPGVAIIGTLLNSTLLVPGVVTGIAFLTFFNTIDVTLGLVKMCIAMTIVCLPYALAALLANYQGLNQEIEEAASDLGASPLQIYFKIVLPQLKPGVIAGSIFIFVEAVDNFSINVFLADLGSNTLPIVTYQHMRNYDDPLVAVIATLLSGMALLLLLLLGRLVGLDRALARGSQS